LISMFVIGEFSSGYIKNIAVTHDNRNRLILSKLPVIALSLLFYCVFNMVLLSIGYSLLIPEIPFGSFLTLFKILGLYYMLYFAVSTAVVAVAVAIRNMTWALMISLLWSTGIPAYLYALLEMKQRRFLGDVYIKFTRIFADAFIVARPELAQGSEILYIIGITVLYTAVWIFLSLFFIKKQDIK
ncbi:MAG: ABC transporter permease, partial [Bacillota bacterium]|nr:ABC transporter permease [Bacillota bacterium]